MKDLTKGNPFKLILLFTIPTLIGNIFQQLYNMADTIIVGNTVGPAAFTGVSLTGPITFMVNGFVIGLTGGFSVRVAQRFGAGDTDGVRRSVAMAYMLTFLTALVVSAIAVPLSPALLRLMKTPNEYFEYARVYLMIIFAGMIAMAFYNIVASLLRAIGDSRTPLYFLIMSAVLNIGLDYLFIVAFKMKYAGAASATVLSQIVSGVCCLLYSLKKYPILRLTKKEFKWDWKLAGGHIYVGLPMALQFSITAIGSIIMQSALNGLDLKLPGIVTAFAAANKLDAIAVQAFISLGVCMTTYVGQNYGAGDLGRVRKGVMVGLLYSAVCWGIGFAFCVGLCEPIMGLFLNVETDPSIIPLYDNIISYGKTYLLFQAGGYGILALLIIYRNSLQGINHSAIAMGAGFAELIARAITAFVFVRYWELIGACMSNIFAWFAGAVFVVCAYYIVMHKYPSPLKKNTPQTEPSQILAEEQAEVMEE